MVKQTIIRVAHSVTRRGETVYLARAFAVDILDGRDTKHSFSIARGETAAIAETQAVENVRKMYRLDNLTEPKTVKSMGRKSAPVVNGHLF